MLISFRASIFLLTMLLPLLTAAETYSSDSAKLKQYELKEAGVKAKRKTLPLSGTLEGTTRLNLREMQQMPQLLGVADPIRLLQLMPGIQTNGELVSGVYMQGCDNAHNSIEIAGAPIFNANHLLGFFSVFNGAHFRSMEAMKSSTGTDGGNKLGGRLSFQPMDTLTRKLHGQLSAGLIESHATLDVPVSPYVSLYASARASYLNLLYGSLLTIDETQMRYGFEDYNATLVWRPSSDNKLLINFYAGNDLLKTRQGNYRSDGRLDWGNLAFSALWNGRISSGLTTEQTAYVSSYTNDFNVSMASMRASMPSDASEYGYKSHFKLLRRNGFLDFGADCALRSILPQSPSVEGSFNSSLEKSERTYSSELSAFAMRGLKIRESLSAEIGLRSTFYANSSYHHLDVDPRVAITWHNDGDFRIKASYGRYHQYVHQALLSGIGMPADFWFPASASFPVSASHSFSLAFSGSFFSGDYDFSVEPYYKKLSSQMEYSGSIMDIITSSYDLKGSIVSGNGYNAGVELLLKKNRGKLTGWVSYSFTLSKRKFPSLGDGWYDSSHSRTNDLSVVLRYSPSRKVSFDAVFVYATGTPFTPIEYFYLINDNIVSKYGKHNAGRMPDYHRLDLSMTYYLKRTKLRESGLNFSLYNAYGHKNALFYYVSQKGEDNISLKPSGLAFNLIPSISFFYKF